MIPYINDIGLSADEIDRVEELHKRFAFVVYNAGFSITTEEGRKVEMCYWQNLRGVRQSALFPGHAAAWRDALRVHEEAVDAVKANPGVHRVARMPAEESKELSYLKCHAEAQGYTFKKGSIGEGQCWVFQGMTEGGHDTHAKAIRGAIKHWARRDPEAFCKAMNLLGEGAEPELLHHDTPVPTFEEDPHRSKRVYGLVEGSPEAVQIRHLEAIGYEFFFTSTSGWVCKQIDRTVACGALMTVVKTAWEMAVSENDAAWQGVGQPPPGTTLWVIPHNTLWGFDLVDTYLCEVLAYHNDHVWLQLLSDTGEVVLGKYITTRIDKVDVKVWKGNKDA